MFTNFFGLIYDLIAIQGIRRAVHGTIHVYFWMCAALAEERVQKEGMQELTFRFRQSQFCLMIWLI